ncbi:MAG TPA: phosphate/phosphite/phosphonate ABC transporter substrate-binding protein [Bauldia sp.]|nr:phosphate/phosphite/phosphonate ABC transporter substrate-binding protein [Bauldia sp.]
MRLWLWLALVALAPLSASAEWRDEIAVLRVGVFVGNNAAYRIAQLQPFRAYLETHLGLPVELVPAETLDGLIADQTGGRVQYAIHSAASYATAAAACKCVEPIAAPVAADGALGFHSVLVVRTESPVKALADARGLRLAVSGPDSVAGRLIPMRAFSHEGIAPEKFFAAIVPKANPEEAVMSLFDGSADIAVAWSSAAGPSETGFDFGVLANLVRSGRLEAGSFRVVWRSPLIPFGPHVVRTDMPDELKKLISDALQSMMLEDHDALDAVDLSGFGAGGFAAPEADLYAPLTELVAETAAAQP